MYPIGWFSTGRDEAARQLLQVVQQAIQGGSLKASISFVFSNREPGESEESDLFSRLVVSYSIPLVTFSSARFKAEHKRDPEWRLRYDREVMQRLDGYPAEIQVLAGYMLIVGAEMCQHYTMINLHPAAPGGPKGTWQDVIWQLIAARATSSGVMMHLVTKALDEGPPITFATYSLRGQPFDTGWAEVAGKSTAELWARWRENLPLFQQIRRYGLAREFPLILATLRAFSEGEVRVEEGRVLNRKGEPIPGYDLTAQVDKEVSGVSC